MIISAVVHLSTLMCGYEIFVQLLECSRTREIGEKRNTEILFVVASYIKLIKFDLDNYLKNGIFNRIQ